MTPLWRLIQSRRNQTCLCSTLSRSHWSPGAAPPYHRVARAADCCLSHDTGQSYSINQCLFSNTEHNTEHGRNKQYKTLERGLLKKLSYGFVYPYHIYLYMFPGHCMVCVVTYTCFLAIVWCVLFPIHVPWLLYGACRYLYMFCGVLTQSGCGRHATPHPLTVTRHDLADELTSQQTAE